MRCPIIAEMRFRAPWVLVTALLALTLPAVARGRAEADQEAGEHRADQAGEHADQHAAGESAAEPAGQSAGVQQLVVEFEFVHGEHAAGEHVVFQHDVARLWHAQLRPEPAPPGRARQSRRRSSSSQREGGRDQSGIAVPAPPPPQPTPLGTVTAAQHVTSAGTSTPAWKIGLLALLAATEAFLVVRLVRDRPGDRTADLSPAS